MFGTFGTFGTFRRMDSAERVGKVRARRPRTQYFTTQGCAAAMRWGVLTAARLFVPTPEIPRIYGGALTPAPSVAAFAERPAGRFTQGGIQ